MVVTCCALPISACFRNASGLKFDEIPQKQLEQGEARVYYSCNKILYLAQAPTVIRPEIQVDGQRIGGIKNGGFIETNVPSGRHYFSMQSGTDQTVWYLNAPSGGNIYFKIWDKTRIEVRVRPVDLWSAPRPGGVEGAVGEFPSAKSPNTLGADVRVSNSECSSRARHTDIAYQCNLHTHGYVLAKHAKRPLYGLGAERVPRIPACSALTRRIRNS